MKLERRRIELKAARVSEEPELKPLKITCTSADCDNGLHCFRRTRRMAPHEVGRCRYCGANLINWRRIHRQDSGDVSYTFNALKQEMVRHHFWHRQLTQREHNHARRKGRAGLRLAAQNRLEKHLKPASPPFDGRQTPWEGNILYLAQHALACCCRTCMEYWHGIPKGKALTEAEVEYFVVLIMLYVGERMPSLLESGEKVPPIRSAP